jgi:O-antigen/teichoic acid export membrane protein
MITNKSSRKTFVPIIVIYFAFSGLFITGRNWLDRINVNRDVLIIGNTILLIATLLSFFLYRRALKNDKPHQFLKFIYGGMFLKMLVCLIAAFIYIVSYGREVNKPAIFGCMFLYFVYTFVEVSILLRLSKQQKNAQTGSAS